MELYYAVTSKMANIQNDFYSQNGDMPKREKDKWLKDLGACHDEIQRVLDLNGVTY